MPNEFEKQVQQKMEELHLLPSEPVWEKIEEQIRKKKDRRRLVIWLPLLCAFLAGGIWWLNSAEDTTTGRQASVPTKEKEQKIPNGSSDNMITAPQATPAEENRMTAAPPDKERQNISSGVTADRKIESNRNVHLQSTRKMERRENIHGNKKKSSEPAKHTSAPPVAGTKRTTVTPGEVGSEATAKENTPATDTPATASVVQPVIATTKNDSPLPADSAFVQVPEVTAGVKKKKWQWGITASGGYGGISNGLNLFGGAKSFDPVPVSLPTTGMYYFDSSPEENDLHLSVGVTASREISRRFAFSTGLQYNQYSTTLFVGQPVTSSTLSTATFSNQFANMGIGARSYTNRFHFIGIPLDLEWRIVNKLRLHSGLLVQELVATNALLYQFSAQVYYNDIRNYRRTQIFSSTGLDYVFSLKKHSLFVGPQLQYSHTRLEKENDDKRLFSVGLRTKFLF